jgi:hypothetical protein
LLPHIGLINIRGNAPGEGNTKYIITGWIEKKSNTINEEFEQDYLT